MGMVSGKAREPIGAASTDVENGLSPRNNHNDVNGSNSGSSSSNENENVNGSNNNSERPSRRRLLGIFPSTGRDDEHTSSAHQQTPRVQGCDYLGGYFSRLMAYLWRYRALGLLVPVSYVVAGLASAGADMLAVDNRPDLRIEDGILPHGDANASSIFTIRDGRPTSDPAEIRVDVWAACFVPSGHPEGCDTLAVPLADAISSRAAHVGLSVITSCCFVAAFAPAAMLILWLSGWRWPSSRPARFGALVTSGGFLVSTMAMVVTTVAFALVVKEDILTSSPQGYVFDVWCDGFEVCRASPSSDLGAIGEGCIGCRVRPMPDALNDSVASCDGYDDWSCSVVARLVDKPCGSKDVNCDVQVTWQWILSVAGGLTALLGLVLVAWSMA